VGTTVGITVGSGVMVGSGVGRIPVAVGAGRAVGRALGRAVALAAGVALAEPAAAAADVGVGLGDGETVAVNCGVALGAIATGARRWVLHCNATSPNSATMTTSARVDAPSALRNDVLSESQKAFLSMASVPPCEPSPARHSMHVRTKKANLGDRQYPKLDEA
jgi:hypothetical protein